MLSEILNINWLLLIAGSLIGIYGLFKVLSDIYFERRLISPLKTHILPILLSFMIFWGGKVDADKFENEVISQNDTIINKTDTIINIHNNFVIGQEAVNFKLTQIDSSQKEQYKSLYNLNHIITENSNDTLMAKKISTQLSDLFNQQISNTAKEYSRFRILFNGTQVDNYGSSGTQYYNSSTDETKAYMEMAKLYQQKKYEQLIHVADSFQKKFVTWYTPSYFVALSSLGISLQNKKFATDIFDKIIKSSSNDPEYLMPISDVYEQMNAKVVADEIRARITTEELAKYNQQKTRNKGFNDIFNALKNVKTNSLIKNSKQAK